MAHARVASAGLTGIPRPPRNLSNPHILTRTTPDAADCARIAEIARRGDHHGIPSPLRNLSDPHILSRTTLDAADSARIAEIARRADNHGNPSPLRNLSDPRILTRTKRHPPARNGRPHRAAGASGEGDQRVDTGTRVRAVCASRMRTSSSSKFGALLRRAKMYTASEAAMMTVT